ncbi:hypothetical protein T552_00405 [Pneumocystis carinii B80]|uniref:Uncharacterized protein n=1 Tax=Pneumocystis carinii (strain B80) TaxID=1408658 RepID=A0A0W4ZQP8_PNEC8|nr:hypothetical protein T552_00405 [Pneumocystis carinii B80]KTW30692.1 hypothetical protein T552_00405 [Pneumocystis carinii B80]
MIDQNKFPEITEEDLINFHENHFNSESLEIFSYFLKKDEKNIFNNANFLGFHTYSDGNIRTLNEEDIAYFKWSESFKSEAKHSTYFVSNKTESLEEDQEMKEELKAHIPSYSKLVRNDNELFLRYGEKYELIKKEEDALDTYYYELSRKNTNHGTDENKIKVNYWPAIPIRI